MVRRDRGLWPVLATALATWLPGRPRRRPGTVPAPAQPAIGDPWTRPAAAAPQAVMVLLDEIERTALATYEAHGLPTRRGHYARSSAARRWRFIAEELSAEERWALVLKNPPEDGWRYGVIEDFGAEPGAAPDLKAAAMLLSGCSGLRRAMRDRAAAPFADTVEAALRLGAEWQALRQLAVRRETPPLKLTPARKPRLPRPASKAKS